METGRTCTTLRSLPETLQMTALPSSPLYLVPSTYIAPTRGYNRYLLAYFRIFFCARHTLRMRIPSTDIVSNPDPPQRGKEGLANIV